MSFDPMKFLMELKSAGILKIISLLTKILEPAGEIFEAMDEQMLSAFMPLTQTVMELLSKFLPLTQSLAEAIQPHMSAIAELLGSSLGPKIEAVVNFLSEIARQSTETSTYTRLTVLYLEMQAKKWEEFNRQILTAIEGIGRILDLRFQQLIDLQRVFLGESVSGQLLPPGQLPPNPENPRPFETGTGGTKRSVI